MAELTYFSTFFVVYLSKIYTGKEKKKKKMSDFCKV